MSLINTIISSATGIEKDIANFRLPAHHKGHVATLQTSFYTGNGEYSIQYVCSCKCVWHIGEADPDFISDKIWKSFNTVTKTDETQSPVYVLTPFAGEGVKRHNFYLSLAEEDCFRRDEAPFPQEKRTPVWQYCRINGQYINEWNDKACARLMAWLIAASAPIKVYIDYGITPCMQRILDSAMAAGIPASSVKMCKLPDYDFKDIADLEKLMETPPSTLSILSNGCINQ